MTEGTMYEILKFFHVLTVVAAVASALLPEVVLHSIARTGDVAAIRGFMPIARRAGMLTGPLFIGAALLGFATALVGGLDLLRPWLIASYAIFVLAMTVGITVSDPWASRIGAAAAASPLESASPELRAATRDARGAVSTAVLMASLTAMIFLMVVKPGG